MAPHFRLFGTYCILYNQTIEEFMEFNPPCKECLVQSMCLKYYNDISPPWIRTRLCANLNEFILANKFIEMTLG